MDLSEKKYLTVLQEVLLSVIYFKIWISVVS